MISLLLPSRLVGKTVEERSVALREYREQGRKLGVAFGVRHNRREDRPIWDTSHCDDHFLIISGPRENVYVAMQMQEDRLLEKEVLIVSFPSKNLIPDKALLETLEEKYGGNIIVNECQVTVVGSWISVLAMRDQLIWSLKVTSKEITVLSFEAHLILRFKKIIEKETSTKIDVPKYKLHFSEVKISFSGDSPNVVNAEHKIRSKLEKMVEVSVAVDDSLAAIFKDLVKSKSLGNVIIQLWRELRLVTIFGHEDNVYDAKIHVEQIMSDLAQDPHFKEFLEVDVPSDNGKAFSNLGKKLLALTEGVKNVEIVIVPKDGEAFGDDSLVLKIFGSKINSQIIKNRYEQILSTEEIICKNIWIPEDKLDIILDDKSLFVEIETIVRENGSGEYEGLVEIEMKAESPIMWKVRNKIRELTGYSRCFRYLSFSSISRLRRRWGDDWMTRVSNLSGGCKLRLLTTSLKISGEKGKVDLALQLLEEVESKDLVDISRQKIRDNSGQEGNIPQSSNFIDVTEDKENLVCRDFGNRAGSKRALKGQVISLPSSFGDWRDLPKCESRLQLS